MNRSDGCTCRIPICCSTNNRLRSPDRAQTSSCISTCPMTPLEFCCNALPKQIPRPLWRQIDYRHLVPSSLQQMISSRKIRRRKRPPHFVLVLGLLISFFTRKLAANPDVVEMKSLAPSIVVDLRYAATHNVPGRALYAAGMRAL